MGVSCVYLLLNLSIYEKVKKNNLNQILTQLYDFSSHL